jgi:tetratricopeptide (TPR) repeat protein
MPTTLDDRPASRAEWTERLRKLASRAMGRRTPHATAQQAEARLAPDRAALLRDALALRDGGSLDSADAALQAAMAAHPEDHELAVQHAVIAEWRGDLDDFLRRWDDVRSEFGHLAIGHAGFAGALRKLGRLDEADTVLGAAIARFPEDGNLRIEQAYIAQARNDPGAALPLWQAVMADFPTRPEGPAGAAAALRGLHRGAEADDVLRRAIAAFPDQRGFWMELAVNADETAATQADRFAALERWREVRHRWPDEPVGFAGQGAALKRLRRFDEADAVLEAGMARFPGDANLGINHAWVADARVEWSEAMRRWDGLRARFPADRRILAGWSECLCHARVAAIDSLAACAEERAAEPARPPRAAGIVPDLAPPAHRELLAGFENLGENCELGFVQRHFGAEPLGLLRWAGMTQAETLAALRGGFADVGSAETTLLHLNPSNREYFTTDAAFGMSMHSFIQQDDANRDRIFEKIRRRLRFLRDLLLQDLRGGDKIFVFQAARGLTEEGMVELHDALRGYGDATLLCVRPAAQGEQPGVVRTIREGLLAGGIDRAGYDGKRWDIAFGTWLDLCRNARRMSPL